MQTSHWFKSLKESLPKNLAGLYAGSGTSRLATGLQVHQVADLDIIEGRKSCLSSLIAVLIGRMHPAKHIRP
jgi:hypothetical protein